jgi:ABC-type multidrug transport system fused ATPase/permease subunit
MSLNGRRLGGELEETISGITDIQVFNAQAVRSQRFREASEAAAQGSVNMFAWIVVSNTTTQIFIALSTALVLLVGILYGPAFGLTLASLIVFVQFVPSMFGPVEQIIGTYSEFRSLVPNLVSTYELLDTKPSVAEKPGAWDMGEVHGNVIFDNVTFGYTEGQNVLEGCSFELREGETVALVGSIGSGKSTIFNLLLRFLDPREGRILIDGHDIADVTLHSLREQVSKLSQFPFFLKESIQDNVRLSKTDASDAEIEEACRLAHIHDVILDPRRMPKGYDTIVDVQVPSGGQKRLIALARCLLRKPEILLLDEPTENLDAGERHLLGNVIREYASERTCLVISHDLDFIASTADRILYLHEGRVAEDGTHEELMRHGGLYKALHDIQKMDPSLLQTRADGSGSAGPATSPEDDAILAGMTGMTKGTGF